MFGGSNTNALGSSPESDSKLSAKQPSPSSSPNASGTAPINIIGSGEKRGGYGTSPSSAGSTEKKRRSSSVSNFLASAKNSLSFSPGRGLPDMSQSPLQKLGKQDGSLAVPQGKHNNSAGESLPGPNSTFRVGVWEDKNRKCRRTMEDTHAFLYNFLDSAATTESSKSDTGSSKSGEVVESDNGYFAIFDGHAGTFAADWCGKKVHIVLEEQIRKNPGMPFPEVLDQTFTAADAQMAKLPIKNSGCTAAVAVLRWENRASVERVGEGGASAKTSQENVASTAGEDKAKPAPASKEAKGATDEAAGKGTNTPSRHRVLYTANVGDARIVLCRNGKALRLSYDHKGSDENEGRRIANAGGLILNNRVNGVLAVTRALGDAYMKDLVTGHPYTTETVIQPELDEFIIIACDGIWDVCSDQEAVDHVRNVQDATEASKLLVDHALSRFSTDNLSCMVIRFNKEKATKSLNTPVDVQGSDSSTKTSEVDKIVMDTKQSIAEGKTPAIGVSATNNGRGYDAPAEDFVPTLLEGAVEEEPSAISDGESPEVDSSGDPAADAAANKAVADKK